MITSAICTSFVNELPQGLHNFQVAGDVFKVALYDNDAANLGASTTVYSPLAESSGTNYTSGGIALTSVTPTNTDNVTLLDFNDAIFSNVTMSNIGGALIYNSTNGNRAVAVLKFNAVVNATAQNIEVIFPEPSILAAILRITRNG